MGDRFLGEIVNDWFTSNRTVSEHYFRMFRGYGWNQELIEDLIERNIAQLRLVIDGGRKLLITNPGAVAIAGKEWDNKGEKQWVLPEDRFEKVFERRGEK